MAYQRRPRKRRTGSQWSPPNPNTFVKQPGYSPGSPAYTPAKPIPAPTPQAAPAGPAAQGLPIDPAYDLAAGAAWSQFANTAAGLEYQRGRTKQEYGFDDPSDPFNRAAMLQRAFQQGQQGTTNRMAAGGQLYSGATQRGLDEGTFRYQRDYSGLRRDYEDKLHGYQQQGAQAWTDLLGAGSNAYADRVARAAQERPEDPGVPEPATAPGGIGGYKPGAPGPYKPPPVKKLSYGKPKSKKPGKYATWRKQPSPVVKPKKARRR